jgi:hypothetical protein
MQRMTTGAMVLLRMYATAVVLLHTWTLAKCSIVVLCSTAVQASTTSEQQMHPVHINRPCGHHGQVGCHLTTTAFGSNKIQTCRWLRGGGLAQKAWSGARRVLGLLEALLCRSSDNSSSRSRGTTGKKGSRDPDSWQLAGLLLWRRTWAVREVGKSWGPESYTVAVWCKPVDTEQSLL